MIMLRSMASFCQREK